MHSRLSFLRYSLAVGLALFVAGAGNLVHAQDPMPPAAQPADTQALSPQQLDNLVAPIALYPDPLLTQVLVASTYPLEIVEAQQWLRENSSLSGESLMTAAQQQTWDSSVQALVAFPDVLARLNEDVRWTASLGNAFLAQQADVLAAIQRLRVSAQNNGRLNSSPQEIVTNQMDNGQSAIEIQPADPQVIYVPVYDPAYIWGPGDYPALFYPTYGFGFGPGFNVGLCFAGWGGGGWGAWGWGPNWFGTGVVVNRAFFINHGFRPNWTGGPRPGIWSHNPVHRLGVPYPNQQLAGQFQNASRLSAERPGVPNAFVQPRGTASRTAIPEQGRQIYRGMPPQGAVPHVQPNPGFAPRPAFPSAPRSVAPPFGGGGGGRRR